MITLGPEKAVYSVLLPEIAELITKSVSEFYVHTSDKETLDQLRWDTVGKFKWWVKDIVDLSEFKYAYPINGVTQGIEQWLLSYSGNVKLLPGEYGWLQVQRPWVGESSGPYETAYISNPFSSNGNFHTKHESVNLPTLLDCAFVGSTAKHKINITPNISAVAFSFSKGFSLNLFRTGFLFSRTPIIPLDTWLTFNYHNQIALYIMRTVMDNFPVDYVYNKFRDTQLDICRENDLIPSDSVFLATTTDTKYDHYKRGDGTNRLCLSREFAKRGLGSFSLPGSIHSPQ